MLFQIFSHFLKVSLQLREGYSLVIIVHLTMDYRALCLTVVVARIYEKIELLLEISNQVNVFLCITTERE